MAVGYMAGLGTLPSFNASQLRNPHLVVPDPDHLTRANLARFTGFGVAIDADFAGGNHGLGAAAGRGKGEQLEQCVQLDEFLCKLKGMLCHQKSALAGRQLEAEQPRKFGTGRWRAHEGFTDEEGVDVALLHQCDVGGGEDPGFGDDDAVGGNAAEL